MTKYKIFNPGYDRIRPASDFKEAMLESNPAAIDRLKEVISPFMSGSDIQITSPETPRTFLIDCSGSMRGATMATTVASILEYGDAMHAAGTPFEILGHTTAAWKGGRPRQEWVEEGRPARPGRLNELLLIVVKGRDESWPDVRDNVYGLLYEGLLKENIDGEAVAWAAERMRRHEDPGQLVIFSDGTPMDDATLAFNPVRLLEDHLLQVLEEEKAAGLDVRALRINNGFGYESGAYPDAETVTMKDTRDRSVNTLAMLKGIDAIIAEPEVELEEDGMEI